MTTARTANRLVADAIRKGELIPNGCEVGADCSGRIEAHHDDYRKPLEVRWLCKRHHAAHHKEHGKGVGASVDHLAKISVYVPRHEAEQFERLVRSEGKTVTGAFRVMLRDYLAAANAPEKPSGHMMGTEAPA